MARDFLGIGMNMGDMANGDVAMGKQDFSHAADRSESPLIINNMAMAGMKNSTWSKAATMQHFLSLRGSTDERFKEQIAENLPEKSFLHFLQMQDLASNTQKNGLHTQVWRQGDSLVNGSPQLCEGYGSSFPMPGGFPGSATRAVISPSKQETMAVSGTPAASEMRLPSSGITDMQQDPPLTIFYAGSVKVFNNISAEQAEAIMFLASTGNIQGNSADLMPATVAAKSINGMATPRPHDKSVMNLHSKQAVVNQQSNANQVNQFTTNMQLDFESLSIPVPSSPVPSGQPLVPTALPHARKASLARFLEKRRERAHSNCPYPVRREDSSLPEERLSSSNDPTCYTPRSDRVDKKKNLIPSWMERLPECSTSDVVVKEHKITAI